MNTRYIAPCGLYCGNCGSNLVAGECHGCGCTQPDCAAHVHHETCYIYQCATEKGIQTCAACEDFPCTPLIQFAYDPIWRTHLPVLDNLRRIRKIGVDVWLEEQADYWADERKLTRWLELYATCTENYAASSSSRPSPEEAIE